MFATSVFLACQTEISNSEEKSAKHKTESTSKVSTSEKALPHWSYNGETGPEHWPELEVSSACDGAYQSPVNLVNYSADKSLIPIAFFYNDSTHIYNVKNNGHTIQYNFDAGDYLNYNGTRYNLAQFHFHEPAEHLVEGIRYPMEIHLVHKSAGGHFAVIAIMAKEKHSSPTFDFLEAYLPLAEGEVKTIDKAFSIENMLPVNRNYFAYTGSLTTPPCTEKVRWLVMQQPIEVSLNQVEKLKANLPKPNYRPEQPLNGREILASDF